MGFMTTITVLNDSFHQIEKNPEEFVKIIKNGMLGIDDFGNFSDKNVNAYGIGNHSNCIKVAQSHHTDVPMLYLTYHNMLVNISSLSDISDLQLRKKLLKIAKEIIKYEEEQIKKLEKGRENEKEV